MKKTLAIIGTALLLSACSHMGGGGGKPAKHSFKPPAGAFNVRDVVEGKRSESSETKDEKPSEETAAPVAAAETSETPPPAEAAPAEKGESVLPPARPKNGKNGNGTAIFPPKEQGLPSDMLLTGSAREADVRAERLHRYLTEKDAPALPGKVIVDVGGGGKLSVVLEIPAEKVPTLEDLRNIATNVTTSTLKAVPEAQIPDEIVTIEVRSGKHKVGTWENGGWKLEELPPAVKEFKKQIKQ